MPQPVLVMTVLLSSVPRALVGVGLLAPAGVGHDRAPLLLCEGTWLVAGGTWCVLQHAHGPMTTVAGLECSDRGQVQAQGL